MRTWIVRSLWALGALALLLLVVRTFVGGVFHVDSGSMAPTLWGLEGGGEWVFVRYTDAAPSRQDLVVAQRVGDSTPIVKRVVGLPGESVLVSGGDVLIDGARIRAGDARPPWVVVFDPAVRPMESAFPILPAQSALWSAAAGGVDLDARALARGSARGTLYFRDAFQDDYLGPAGELVRGEAGATDARIESVVTVRDAGARFRLGITEQGDTFQAHVRVGADGACDLAITRQNALDDLGRPVETTVATAAGAWPLGTPRRVAFENRDNVLTLVVEGIAPLVHAYRENVRHRRDELGEGKSFGFRLWIGGEGGRTAFRDVRVLRDLTYTERGIHGVGATCELGPDEYFLLGDLSSQSRDSRDWGPVRAGEIVGRPVAVVWPPARWRRLRPVEGDS